MRKDSYKAARKVLFEALSSNGQAFDSPDPSLMDINAVLGDIARLRDLTTRSIDLLEEYARIIDEVYGCQFNNADLAPLGEGGRLLEEYRARIDDIWRPRQVDNRHFVLKHTQFRAHSELQLLPGETLLNFPTGITMETVAEVINRTGITPLKHKLQVSLHTNQGVISRSAA